MEIIVNGTSAVVKSSTSFDFVAENPDFDGSGEYSFKITFPIKDCEVNSEIFGDIYRSDIEIENIKYNCEISSGNFRRSGCLIIKGGNEAEVECQFIGGVSVKNYDRDLDNEFINELNLGSWPIYVEDPASTNNVAVALPWVSEQSGNIQNVAQQSDREQGTNTRPGSGAYRPHNSAAESSGLSFMPYLIYIAKAICNDIGFSYDFSQWEKSDYRYLLICNTLPYVWDIKEYARALPKLSVKEFFENIGLLLNGYFDIDVVAEKISFDFREARLNNRGIVEVVDVIDELEYEIDEDEREYIDSNIISFSGRSDQKWSELCCDWYFDKPSLIISFPNHQELQDYFDYNFKEYYSDERPASWGLPNGIGAMYKAEDIDTYFAIQKTSKVKEGSRYKISCVLVPINIFGSANYKKGEDVNEIKMPIAPVCIDYTDEDNGYCMFLNPSSFNEEDYSDESSDESIIQPGLLRLLRRGKQDEKSEYYSSLYVAFWDGESAQSEGVLLPHVDNLVWYDGSIEDKGKYSLRLNSKNSGRSINKIDGRKKYKFSFLADDLYDPQSIFLIKGQKYVCAKLTANVSAEIGMSSKIKGEFYKIID